MDLPDFVRSGNQAADPAVYEIENQALDRSGVVLAAMRSLAPWAGKDLLDLGCGSGFWLPGYADEAASVLGVEPDPILHPLAAARDARVTVLPGSAEHLPMPDQSVDVVHARFAYFFPPGVDAGLREVLRVLRPGGSLVVVDNDYRNGQFASLLALSPYTTPDSADVSDGWWSARGATRTEVMSSWQFDRREDLEAVLRLEFPRAVADAWLVEHPAVTGLSYGYVLFAVPAPDC